MGIMIVTLFFKPVEIMKTHFALIEDLENSFNPIYSEPICGSGSENVTDDKDFVSCKKCLNKLNL
ncbi:protein of unknown function [Tenacibaculum sp. 190524A02b]